jgi:hypothetical protein
MEIVSTALLLAWLAVCLLVLRFFARKYDENQRDPCETCLRWEDCGDCPLREGVK